MTPVEGITKIRCQCDEADLLKVPGRPIILHCPACGRSFVVIERSTTSPETPSTAPGTLAEYACEAAFQAIERAVESTDREVKVALVTVVLDDDGEHLDAATAAAGDGDEDDILSASIQAAEYLHGAYGQRLYLRRAGEG